ncbi:MAG TPA: hemin uptake protein HemP [Piscinibacter sp.]|jgi:hemin uptake protein HemP|uniref:hemin uptake protein HemP n=1 Tax=Piscinibacter sp. TaxID=1903157 RepID=UPI001B469F88|nr:hemin uptake protein HemP [Piscinibacter sp.]MBK7530901.1 hemin uptake protein HemP [Piscinibacter sp.]MBP6544672.1 hemin uptake protein HemP [Piscinibacter sp.]HOY35091.1 hemin uptake protein HemP [Piscinibacter sp.]HPG81008.1 hemin uptake protein HemP [Piscinibacter sp.]HPM69094.1 hemin uptake protein HemP [Piscinibacter sp.]
MDSPQRPPPPIRPAPTPAPADVAPQRIDSALLLRGATELLIDHHGVLYRLRQTALGKLILTK